MRRLGILLGGLVLTACGTETSSPPAADPGPAERPRAVPAAEGPVTTGYPATVLDDGTGPELCLGGVLDSLPPQCDGPRLIGWDWEQQAGRYESRSGVRWGEFAVTGTFDGTSLTVTDAVDAEHAPARPEAESPFVTP
jgi:hypothetical protein